MTDIFAKITKIVHLRGHICLSAPGLEPDRPPFETQAAQVLANMKAALLASGSGVDRLVQVRIYLDDMSQWPQFDRIYSEWAGTSRPARAVVPTGPLHFGFKVEVEAIAVQ